MPTNDLRSVSEVLQDIFGNLQDIVRSEIRLVKVELQTEAGKTAKAARVLILGGVLGVYAGGLFLLAAVYGLSLILQPWMAALSVGALVFLLAAVMIGIGRARLRIVEPKSERIPTKENVQWLKDQTR